MGCLSGTWAAYCQRRWRPFALPYWVAWAFLVGSVQFIVGSFAWMLPGVGDGEHGAPAWEVLYSVTYPYLGGSIFFTIGRAVQPAARARPRHARR